MNERYTGEPILGDLKLGRDLYVKLFENDTPLINLGYSTKQIQFTKRALSTMDEEGIFFPTTKPRVYFGDPDGLISENLNPHVWLTTLKNGGYKTIAEYPLLWTPDKYNEDKGNISSGNFKTDLPIEEFPGEVVSVINILPSGEYQEPEELIRHLYEGAWLNHYHERDPKIGKPTLTNWLKSRFTSSLATFRGGWIDDSTKLELVVETDVYTRLRGIKGNHITKTESGIKNTTMVTEIWRCLPKIEYESVSWVPFGKKPNPSNHSIQKALESMPVWQTTLNNLVTNQ